MDQIQIRGLKLFAYHGVNPEEKQDGQNFELDVTLFTSVKRPGRTDDLNDTINYSKAVKCITRVMLEESYDLIERAASRVAQELLTEFSSLDRVTVRLKKPEAPIQADFDYVAVEITRSRGDFTD
ncbi:MAG: dihydroneopterin aldolase [Clostridiales bacterium]|jgi:dihydroneopterin aldolase|nr:dihydroneopterin aldolase [Clostridiales bacterium]